MTVTAKVLIPSKTAEDVQYTQYTTGSVTTILDKFTALNYGTVAAELRVHLVTRGDSAGNHNLAVIDTIPAGSTYLFPELVGHALMTGGFVSTIASVADSITIRASGREIS